MSTPAVPPQDTGAADDASARRSDADPGEQSPPTGSGTTGPAAPDAAAGRAEPPHQRSRSVARGVGVFLREIVIVVGLALVLAFVAKTWFVQSFYIPSGSMMNTLTEDDRVIVSKLTPGPFDLKRGDIVVFEDPAHWLHSLPPQPVRTGLSAQVNSVLTWVGLLPSDAGNHLIKRVIGLPGDRVKCCTVTGQVSVNGTAITEPYLYPGDAPSKQPFDITVPAGKLWVMGDHRSDSADSRFNDTAEAATNVADETTATDPKNKTGYYGSVPIDRVVGRAMAVILPLSKATTLGTPEETFAGVPAAPASEPAPTPNATPGTPTGVAPNSSSNPAPGPTPSR